MQTAIARGRFMEKIGAPSSTRASSTTSSSPAPSRCSTCSSAQACNRPSRRCTFLPIYDALVSGDGVYAPFLKLARALESFDEKQLATLADDLHITR
jgi:EAL and modified HD-GYP domain-containing signal transduction protein